MNFDASPETLAQQFSVSYDEATHQTSLSVATSTHEAQNFLVVDGHYDLASYSESFLSSGAVLKEDGDLELRFLSNDLGTLY